MNANCRVCLPAAEIRETENAFTVQVELPGSTRDDIKVWQESNMLTVSGEKKAQTGNGVLNERVFGKFQRAFRLPENIDREKIEANYADGVVTVEIPKLEKAKPRNIDIN